MGLKRLIDAAEQTWKAFLKYGPVDDGRPEGTDFDNSLEELMCAFVEAKFSYDLQQAKRKEVRYGKTKNKQNNSAGIP